MSKYAPPPPPPPPRQQCATARRLAYLRKLCEGVRCATTRRVVQRVAAAWWGAGEVVGADVRAGRG